MNMALTLTLPQKTRAACREDLTAGLSHAARSLQSVVDLGGADKLVAETILDSFGRKQSKPKWMSKDTLATFVRDCVMAIVNSQRIQQGAESVRDTPALQQPDLTAEWVLSELATLPWKYNVMLPLPISPDALPSTSLDLSDSFTLRVYDRLSADAFTSSPLEERRFAYFEYREVPSPIAPNVVHLVYQKVGYICDSAGLDDLREFSNAAKSVLGLLYVAGICYFDPSPPRQPSIGVPVHVYRERDDGSWTPAYRWFRYDDSATVRRFGARKPWPMHDEPHERLFGVLAGFQDVSTRTAARWYVDSISGEEEALQIVQAIVVLEILLGDRAESDVLGLRSLIANRLAYLVGTTPAARSEILKKAKRLYDLRSAIVHGGTLELDESQRQLVELQTYAEVVLRSQMYGLREDARAAIVPTSG